MIENPFPIAVKPGLFLGDHTDKESAGRWIDGDLVSFQGPEGLVRPIESGLAMTKAGAGVSGTPRAMFAWYDATDFGRGKVILMTSTSPSASKLYIGTFLTTNTLTTTDITPTGGFAVSGAMSVAIRDTNVFIAFGTVGAESALYKYDMDVGGPAAAIANFTTVYAATSGIAITPEDFLVAIARGNQIAWASQGTSATWAPSSTNSAGSLPMPGAVPLRILVVGRETLIFTKDGGVWAMDYVGGDLVYGLREISPGADIYGVGACAVVHSTVYWMGTRGFYQYDGFVRDLPSSDIDGYVFDTLLDPTTSGHRCYTTVHSDRKEIWWHIPTLANTGADRIVIYNWENQTWSKGDSFNAPVGALVGGIQISSDVRDRHVFIDSAGNVTTFPVLGSVRAGAFVESGLLPFDDGSRLYHVNRVFHDGGSTSDIVTLWSRLTDNGSESAHVMVPDSDKVSDTRFLARYLRYKHQFGTGTGGMGIPKLGIIPGSRR